MNARPADRRLAALAPRILVAGADEALFALLEEWLAAAGCEVVRDSPTVSANDRVDAIVFDVPFPLAEGMSTLDRLSRAHPGTPILALSSSFFASVDSTGPVARTLRVASALAKPVRRNTLVSAVHAVVRPST